jgi:hypothetical protein
MDIEEMMANRRAAEARREHIAREQEQHRLEDAAQPYKIVALLEQVVARLDSQQALLAEIRDALRHRGEAEAPPGHTVRY